MSTSYGDKVLGQNGEPYTTLPDGTLLFLNPGDISLVAGGLERARIKSDGTISGLVPGGTARTDLGPEVFFDLETSMTGTGSSTQTSRPFTFIITSDDVAQPSSLQAKVDGLNLTHNFGGASTVGGRNSLEVNTFFNGGATSASNFDRDYVSIQGQVIAFNSDGGTSISDYRGALFGLASWAEIRSTDSYFMNVTGCEFDTKIAASTNPQVYYASGIQIAGSHARRGETYDCGIAISGLDANHLGYQDAILIGDMNGAAALGTDSTVLRIINQAVLDKGFNFEATAFASYVLDANGFKIEAPNGNHAIHIGRINASSTPFMDWHSGTPASATYDFRFIADGGDGTDGHGRLSAEGQFRIQGANPGWAPIFEIDGPSGNTVNLTEWHSNTNLLLSVLPDGKIKTSSGNESTGAASAALGANSPATVPTAPYKWLEFVASDGTTVYVPAWK